MKTKLFFATMLTLICLNGMAQNNSEQLQDRSFMIKYFMKASKEFKVPIEILEGIGFVESHWVQRIPTNHGGEHMPPSYGVMGLRDDSFFGHSLIEAAKLIHATPDKLKTDASANIRGAAALLKKYADEQSKNKKTKFLKLEDWKSVLERYPGIPQPQTAQIYSHDVYYILNKGYNQYGIKINKVQIKPEMLVDPLLK